MRLCVHSNNTRVGSKGIIIPIQKIKSRKIRILINARQREGVHTIVSNNCSLMYNGSPLLEACTEKKTSTNRDSTISSHRFCRTTLSSRAPKWYARVLRLRLVCVGRCGCCCCCCCFCFAMSLRSLLDMDVWGPFVWIARRSFEDDCQLVRSLSSSCVEERGRWAGCKSMLRHRIPRICRSRLYVCQTQS
jgi:hypothetical protein